MQKIHTQKQQYYQHLRGKNPWILALAVVGLLGGGLLIASFLQSNNTSQLLCGGAWGARSTENATALQLEAILHYATARVVPQQSLAEISVSFEILRSLGPSNFLVFGLGHDSLMWTALNARGKTLFLEEDPVWVQTVLKDAPTLRTDTVRYRTRLSEANELLRHYSSEPDCSAKNSFIRGNDKCRLALNMLSDEVYDTEWDLIMVDAPRGYFAAAPGRMAAIYSAAVMARNRKKSGVTHVFVHDVDRKVEKIYAKQFLCKKQLVKAVGRLWHFEIPPAANADSDFC
ncbi:Glucuronoxylan 4-O-methyltransferase [Handroanthus impetiginosus]|uniref:Glucuronoxylan 4-O-methyltransferase n=1 Tax=Handroanthus impetiginosus TaxID=429701 RepID=A0A2G9FZQ2_9LAMI|nr:Glucuronoxylan 4-O-methyltransferase [Handroanthus impetiginosus]